VDFEYARDRIMMGIERKSLSMSDRERMNTAIHEAGHAIICYFSPGAKKLYKATIVARGSSLGAVITFNIIVTLYIDILSSR
jgi:cell division protease FtsH